MPPIRPDPGDLPCNPPSRAPWTYPVTMSPIARAPQPNAHHVLAPSVLQWKQGWLTKVKPWGFPLPGPTILPCGCGHAPRWHSIQQSLKFKDKSLGDCPTCPMCLPQSGPKLGEHNLNQSLASSSLLSPSMSFSSAYAAPKGQISDADIMPSISHSHLLERL